MFHFRQFTIRQRDAAMKVTTDACVAGAWAGALSKEIFGATQPGVLDIGAGTGLLSLMMAQQLPHARVTAIEIDPATATEAGENFHRSPWSSRLEMICADILHWQTRSTFDCIISNPPFYESELQSPNIGRNQAHHSSHLALYQLLGRIKDLLNPQGRFFLLLPYKRKGEYPDLFANAGLFLTRVCRVRQSPRHDYFRLLVEGSVQPCDEILISEIQVRDGEGKYSEDFRELLRDYYLEFNV